MSIDREAIYVALFNRLKSKLLVANGGRFVTIGRRHRQPPRELSPVEQPALFSCAVQEESNVHPLGTGGKLDLWALLFIYVFQQQTNEPAGEETELAETMLHTLLKDVDDALGPDKPGLSIPWSGTNLRTLDGLVARVSTEGVTQIDPAILDPQASAIVPVHILCP